MKRLEEADNEATNVTKELKQYSPPRSINVTTWTKPDAKSIVNALSPLVENLWTPAIFHFAGHGISSARNPFASAIYLYDDRLDVSLLLRARVWRVALVLAYLSACSTGTSTAGASDESVNIMTGFLTVGFMNVIGTLWEVDDTLSCGIATQFYSHWVEQKLEPKLVAYGLQVAVAEVAVDNGISPEKWACYVHTGV